MSEIQMFAVLSLLGFMSTEGAVEYLFGNMFDLIGHYKGADWVEKNKPVAGYSLKFVSAIVGVFFAFYYALDGISLLSGLPVTPVGTALTGIVVGRGANGVRWVFSLVRDWKEGLLRK